MSNTVCDPFDYEHLSCRNVNDLLQIDAPYAFSKKQLKYLRPLLEVVLNKKMAQDPSVRPALEKMLRKHLKNSAGLTESKWKTLCHEMVMREDIALAEIWVDARSNGWEILKMAPGSSSHVLQNIVAVIIPYLIDSNHHQKLCYLINSWSKNERDMVAQMCYPLYTFSPQPGFVVDLAVAFGNTVSPLPKIEPIHVSKEMVEVFPEYFTAQVERGLKDFVEGQMIANTLANFLPPNVLNPLDPQKHEGIRRAFQYFEMLPKDLQDDTLEKIKSSSYAHDLWAASPEFKAFVEKKTISEALNDAMPSKIRRSKI